MSEQVIIHTPFIKLEQLLKLAGTFPTGGACKEAVQNGRTAVNGEICTQRGKKLHPGDIVTCGKESWEVTAP